MVEQPAEEALRVAAVKRVEVVACVEVPGGRVLLGSEFGGVLFQHLTPISEKHLGGFRSPRTPRLVPSASRGTTKRRKDGSRVADACSVRWNDGEWSLKRDGGMGIIAEVG